MAERAPARRSCPECSGRIVTQERESFYAACGLVVAVETVDRRPTRAEQGPTEGSGPEEWSCESINPLRVDKGLHTTFFLGTDGYGNSLSKAQKDRFGRLRRRHKRFQMDSDRAIRLNEGLRDIESIGGNLALPDYVVEDAARLLKRAAAERLPGGRMSWEALAAGAVLLAARDADLERSSAEVAHYAKSHQERVCAAARKVRCDLGLAAELPPVRAGAVEAVLAGLDEPLDGDVRGQVARVGRHLLELADEEPVGPGTSRVTMAASAVYAADRLTPGKYLIQEQVVAAGKTVLDTSKSKVGRYSRELVEVYEERHGEGPAGDPDPAWVALAGGD